ncbi:UDP-N-acetylmuramoyl-L-alanine--D-glutamate ligase [Sedimentibacter sp. MB31-C6]|uniref:UDP-N-acetylmuramoyl-L-alanine--D-glutamate ligase n=1 Tax=Sedimentibacter sp. MB31-C6 TaxID=3109366 RepID=UPI002DDC9C3D|nr:UDP-N-acetylmuramoyl-L-alanine--D-glutamate ligase [Sedimentibacter sp. MB36-C1]WSI03762.1 UDP-N-acetylmuramoyl-L-alanine--D-glutamate ligase [Sedimentibacter sp. MB36-C1]
MFNNKKILVIGLGVSGISCVKGLSTLGAEIYVYDESPKEKNINKLKELEKIKATYYFGSHRDNINFDLIDLAIKSPGIKYETSIIKKLLHMNIKVISDLEAAYLITKATIISITGTNGKTTTTTLIGEIVKKGGISCKLTGNIGSGIFNDALNSTEEEVLVAEVSSFQLAGTNEYKPHISVTTNITPDHLDYHQTMDNYIEAKFKNVCNQGKDDYAILNYEDRIIREYSNKINAKKIFFSTERILDEGIFIDEGKVFYKDKLNTKFVFNVADIFIPGKHNVENALAATGAALALKIEPEIIAKVLEEFKGVEHRLEFCGEYNGVKFYNDSKGTNPDASIKAVEGIEKPIILIAGGYDKKSTYDDFIKSFDEKVKALILLGQTADDIERCAKKYDFHNIYKVLNMDEAVKKSFELSGIGDNVVLSPACASWGMYPNYEVRGKDFKERVKYYGGINTQS